MTQYGEDAHSNPMQNRAFLSRIVIAMSYPNAAVMRARLSSRARIRQIEVFVAVAQLAGVHSAAQQLGISQPGASKHLQDLERLLEAPLFLRHAKGMSLTATGEQLLPVARAILAHMDEVAERTATLNGSGRSLVKVWASQGAVASMLSEGIPAFNQWHPHILVSVHEADPVTLASMMVKAEADLIVGRQPMQSPPGWTFTPIQDDRLVVLAGPQHPLAAHRGRVTLTQLAQAIWLTLPLHSHGHMGMERLFAGRDWPPLWPLMTRSPLMIWKLLRSQEVLALLPASYVHEFLSKKDLITIPAAIDLPLAPIGVIVPEGAAQATRMLANFLMGHPSRTPPPMRHPSA